MILEGFWPYPPYLVILFRCYSDPYNSLGHRYLTAPTPEEDPEYHEIGRDLADLRAATEACVKSLRYPGDAPPSTPANISNLIFRNDFPSRIHKD